MTPSQLEDSAKAPWTRTTVGFIRSSFGLGLLGGLAEPVLEAGRGDARVVARGEGAVVELGAEVAGVNVGRDLATVVACLQDTPGELVEAKRLRARQLDRVVQWRADGDIGQCAGHVIGCLGLDEGGRQANGVALGARIGDPADELEELRCADDRVGDGPGLDQLLLRDLRAHVAALGSEPVRADDRQRDVVSHAGGRLCGEQVAGCGLEEVEHGRVFPGGCVRHVDDDLGALECFGEPLARERVDSRVRRRRERFVTALPQLLDELRPNEAGSANDNDLHLVPFVLFSRGRAGGWPPRGRRPGRVRRAPRRPGWARSAG